MNATIKTNYGNIEVELFENIAPKTVQNFVGLATGEKEWIHPTRQEKIAEKFYDGLIFHRVIPEFMIQGGCPIGDGTGGPGYQFEDECFEKSYEIKGEIKNDLDAVIVFNEILIPYMKENYTPDAELKKIVDDVIAKQKADIIKEHDVDFYKKKTGNDKPIYSLGDIKAKIEYGTICMANAGPNTNGSQFFIVTKRDGAEWLNGKHTVFGKVIRGMEVAHHIENLPRNAQDRPNADVAAIIDTIEISD